MDLTASFVVVVGAAGAASTVVLRIVTTTVLATVPVVLGSVWYIVYRKGDIEKTLVVIESRKINNGHSISYKGDYYKLLDKNCRTIALPPGSSVSMIKTIDGKNLYATDRLNVCYALEIVKERHVYSKSIDSDDLKPKPKEKNKYIPDKTHPWSWIRQKEFRTNDKLMKSLEPIYRSPHEAVYS